MKKTQREETFRESSQVPLMTQGEGEPRKSPLGLTIDSSLVGWEVRSA